MITFKDVVKNEEVMGLIKAAEKQLRALGYTEHSTRHATIVATRTEKILSDLEYDERTIELGKIAAYLHDIGNVVNRVDHAHSGAILAYNLLKDMGMNAEERAEIIMAIGNHDENTGSPISPISAAVILADKSDAHRDRVVNLNVGSFDIHDRVNYAVTNSTIFMDKENKKIILDLTIDIEISPVLDYFEIFMERTMMSKRAANFLNIWFELVINGTKLL